MPDAADMLRTFDLTDEQIKTLTPLSADLACALGIDPMVAAKHVGRSAVGLPAHLVRVGIHVDIAHEVYDPFAATVLALRGQVEGIAEVDRRA